jgi:hypothetical protein
VNPTTHRRLSVLVLVVLLGAAVPMAADDLRDHVEHLASAEYAGRLTGTPEANRAAKYLAAELKRLGARPLPGQEGLELPFEFTAGMDDAGTTLVLTGADGKERRWDDVENVQALSFSDNASVTGELVFAGYGLSLPDGKDYSYDSFMGLDLEGKIAVMLRYVPEDVDQETRAKLASYSGLRYKALHARELGAKAILVITGPRSPNAGTTVPMAFDTALSGSGIVAVSVGAEISEAIFSALEDKTLEQTQASLDTGNPHVTGFEIPGITVTIEAKVDRQRKEGFNVVGYLPASGDGEAEYLVLGAHYDHLGHGKHGNSLAGKEEAGKIHYGADDNASGVAAVLVAAHELAEGRRKRNLVVALWSGEELGVLGSSQFVKDELLPMDRVAAYLNFDMVGRLRDDRLSLQGVGSSTDWPRLIEQTNVVVGLDVNTLDDPYLPTDAMPFYLAGVPVVHFFTGSHEDYHRPTDTAERINYEGVADVVRFATLLTRKLDARDSAPEYAKVERKSEGGGGRDTLRAFTGTIPDYTTEVDGLLLSGVIEGGPADQGGLREGDVIVEFAGQKIANIYDYTYALDAVKIDQPVKVVFMRDGERQETEIKPTSRK